MNYKEEYEKKYWLEAIFDENKELTKDDRALIKKAYLFAEIIHKKQKRASGKPYFIHLVETAKNLAKLRMDGIVISAGLLHDSLEDKVTTTKEIKKNFGEDINFLIKGVTKLGKVKYKGMQRHNESLRKLLVATSKDIRVLIIKFADRIHNLQTLEYVKKEKQKRIATESLEIYTPLAYRLGISTLSKELGDLSFPYVYPKEHERIKKFLKERSKENMKNLKRITRSISKKLVALGMRNFKITHRVKALLALHKKLNRKKNDEKKIYDIIAMRIIVPTIEDCYQTLGIIHQNFKSMPGRIKDYIAVPKTNGYKSIHTTIFTGHGGGLLEIQIRTDEMHTQSEFGAASHLGYKMKTIGVAGLKKKDDDWVNRFFSIFKNPFERKKKENNTYYNNNYNIPWIKNISHHIKEENTDSVEFEKKLKTDLFSDRIFIFTPNGDVIDLPIDSTSVDFAYQIHTKIGNTINGTKINGHFKSLDTKLKNSDMVEIITKKKGTPNIKWLKFVKTNLARRRIRKENEK